MRRRTSGPSSLSLLSLCCLTLAALAGSPGGRADDTSNVANLLTLGLDELMNTPVVTASRYEQPLWRAPAVVTVLDGESLRQQGYRSLGEALSQVPGLYPVQDGVGTYIGVRGIGSGQRAYGRTLKVMIDGQPIGLRHDASQMLGPELIPLAVVDKVEVVRGPASALYGADAYLGVINIITRREAPPLSLGLAVGAQAGSEPGLLAEAMSQRRHDGWRTLVAGRLGRLDRSGLHLPASSPLYGQFADPQSRRDDSRPLAAYARLDHASATWNNSLSLHASRQDSDGEFLDFGTLSHGNRIVLRQQTLAWQSDWMPDPDQRYRLRLAHAWGGPDARERLNLGASYSYYPERDFGYRAWDLGLEGSHWLTPQHNLVWGLDGSWDDEELMTVYSIDNTSGQRTLASQDLGQRLFRNQGVYLQYQWQADTWGLSLNGRHDDHNLYGTHNSYRAGLTAMLHPRLSGKLLYGTAFKAPNAFQLFAQPLYASDIIGNAALRPETATTTEAHLAWQVLDELGLTLTAYHLLVRKLIELQPLGFNQRWANRGEETANGLETELRWRRGSLDATLASAWQDAVVTLDTPLQPTFEVATASQPRLQLRLALHYQAGDAHYGLEGRHASARRASDANIELKLKQVYQLPAYQVWRLYWQQGWGAHRFGLALDNAFDHRYGEPGYGGIDLPAPRRSLWLSWSWQP